MENLTNFTQLYHRFPNGRTATQAILSTLILIGLLAAGCTGTPAPATQPAITPQFTLSAVPTREAATAAPTSIPLPSATAELLPTITIIPILPVTRRTPPTLMLHRSNLNFDAVQFLKDFILILKQNQMHVITYRDITSNPGITAREQGGLFIISIDDIYLRYPIDPSVLLMITALRQAGYPAVLAVITEGNYAYPETVRTLKQLSDAGWEIASHTDRHSNLGEMEKTAPRYVYTEVQTSLDKIETAIGARPYTLILPDGQMVKDPRFIKRAGILWIVGITGGSTYNSSEGSVYVGREGPDGDAAETFHVMMGRFNP